jgi:putative SOS response-associated peptidase YedK
MCGRYTSTTPASDLAEYFGVDEVVAPEVGARFNVAPTDEVYAVAESSGGRRLGTFRWGLVPFWAKDEKVGVKMINARAESLLEKSAFRRPLERRRCLIPADGFYEWEKVGPRPERPSKRGAQKKQPWYITRHDGKPMAFAGLWDSWRPVKGSDEGRVQSCVIITGEPNEKVAALHDRMPVMLPPEAWDAWLDPANDDVVALQALLVPAPAELFDLVPVGTGVNDVRNDGPQLIEPIEPEPTLL